MLNKQSRALEGVYKETIMRQGENIGYLVMYL